MADKTSVKLTRPLEFNAIDGVIDGALGADGVSFIDGAVDGVVVGLVSAIDIGVSKPGFDW